MVSSQTQFFFKNTQWMMDRPYLFGILNLTPDSFSDGGQYLEPDRALKRATAMIQEGVDAIDLGGESTRPGAKNLSVKEEWSRLKPVLTLLQKQVSIPLSVDTRKAEIAHQALNEGASIINDVSGGRYQPLLLKEVAKAGAGYILMHSRGAPDNMMEYCQYKDLLSEIKTELAKSFSRALDAGILAKNILLDPGFGFAKTCAQNDFLLDHLELLTENFGPWATRPYLMGISRKRFLREKSGPCQEKLLALSIQGCKIGFEKGVRAFRVHDVGPTKIELFSKEQV